MSIEEIRATTRAAQLADRTELQRKAASHQQEKQASWYALLDCVKAAIRKAAEAGQCHTEVVVPGGQQEARDLAGHFQADGFTCSVKPGLSEDNYPQVACAIIW